MRKAVWGQATPLDAALELLGLELEKASESKKLSCLMAGSQGMFEGNRQVCTHFASIHGRRVWGEGGIPCSPQKQQREGPSSLRGCDVKVTHVSESYLR